MSLSANQKQQAVLHAIKITEQAVSSAGPLGLNAPHQVTALIEQTTIKIQELMEKAESGK
jgi:hypothetical protein